MALHSYGEHGAFFASHIPLSLADFLVHISQFIAHQVVHIIAFVVQIGCWDRLHRRQTRFVLLIEGNDRLEEVQKVLPTQRLGLVR